MYLLGKKINLRSIEENDLELLRELINDPETERMTLGFNYPISEYHQRQWFYNLNNNKDCIRWIIASKDNSALGMCTLSDIDWKNRSVKIGIKLKKTYKSKGIGSESYNLMINYAFTELQMNRIEAEVVEYNKASINLHHKLGFSEEGKKRLCIYQNGKYHNVIIFSILKDEFKVESNL